MKLTKFTYLAVQVLSHLARHPQKLCSIDRPIKQHAALNGALEAASLAMLGVFDRYRISDLKPEQEI